MSCFNCDIIHILMDKLPFRDITTVYDIELTGQALLKEILSLIMKRRLNAKKRAYVQRCKDHPAIASADAPNVLINTVATVIKPPPSSSPKLDPSSTDPPCLCTTRKRRRKRHKNRLAKKAQLLLPSLMDINLPDKADKLVWVSRAPSFRPSWTPTCFPQPGTLRPVGSPPLRSMASRSNPGITSSFSGDLQDAEPFLVHHPGHREPAAHQDHLLRQ